ncbi:hypothetical protein KFE25_010290 [Diacronema lutheri]|uniref:Saposin B-type domain-containing protein n=1 Tax=Diacronema lutheri TaxID=2081491 RepID=A0A8J5XGE8_DIALT|nr:hypothetical protein KFE25_010290 [Diacronema lutheri]
MRVALLALAAFGLAGAQMGMSGEEEEMLEELGVTGTPMGRKNQEPKAPAVKSDLPYIRCEVCRRAVELAYAHAKDKLDKRFKHKAKRRNEFTQFEGEAEIQEFIEKVCVVDKPDGPGEWIRRTDLISDGDKLVLYDTGAAGHCERECRTIEQACDEVVDAADTDFSEALYEGAKQGLDLEKVQRMVCNRSAKVCKTKPPPLSPDRIDYPFRAMTDDEKHMADMMANLKSSGMGGTMYRREDLMKGMDGLTAKFGEMTGIDPEADSDGLAEGVGEEA